MQQVVQVYATNSDFLAAWMGQHKNHQMGQSRLHQLVFVKLRQKWLVGRLTRKKLHPSSFVFAL
jgi:hypothetical protein